MESPFDSRYILKGIVLWKRHLLKVAVISTLASVIFSGPFFIPPRYKSHAQMYPVNLIPYGIETPAEQLLQLLQSSEVRNGVLSKLKLHEHYDIDSDPLRPNKLLLRRYDERVIINKTEYESVEIVVMDEDPKMACRIAEEIISGMNQFARKIQREKSSELHSMYSKQLAMKGSEIDSLQSKLKDLRVNYGILDFDREARYVGKEHSEAISKGVPAPLMQKHRNFAEKGGEYQKAIAIWKTDQDYYNKVKAKYDDVTADLFKELTYANVVSKPYVATDKAYPVRWLIVVLSVSGSLVLTIFLLFLLKKEELK
ncbi:MAG: hypothetical protein RLZZ46_1060 [Bacteroidota bacterium]|jgi:uncharacterized protein involved in exopolysaccharide biosynthesis